MNNKALKTCFFFALAASCTVAIAQARWTMDSRSATGPVAIIELPNAFGKSRVSMIVFEYLRKSDPLISYVEMAGKKFGKAEKQSLLPPSNIGGKVNGKHYTGTAAATIYSNGFEVGFGMPDEMAFVIAFDEIRSLSFITPTGKEILIPTNGLRAAVDAALEVCTNRVK
jgi:hypothetical protein